MASWISQIADHDIRKHYASVGLKSMRGHSYGPCPACGSDARGSSDKRGPIGLTKDGHGWTCHGAGCNGAGDLADLLAWKQSGARVRELTQPQMQSLRREASSLGLCDSHSGHGVVNPISLVKRSRGIIEEPTRPPVAPPSKGGGGHFRWRETLPVGALEALWSDPDAQPVLDYLFNERKFSEETIKRWGLGAMLIKKNGEVVERWLTIPLVDGSGTPVNVRFRRLPGTCLYCSGSGCSECKDTGLVQMKPKYRVCAGRPLPLFGIQNLTAKDSPVIITEGELDVLALDEYGWPVNVVSGTAGGTAEWPDAWLDPMEDFSSFILALDDDDVGNKGAEKLAQTLGRWRCSRAILSRKDAGQCLTDSVAFSDIRDAIEGAEGMMSLSLARPTQYGDEIETLIQNPTKLIGLQTSIPSVNTAWGGLTAGLYVFTGETGEGKTTFTTWLCWDLLSSAATPIVLTSFEQRPIGTVQKLLRMELGSDFTKRSPTERRDALDRLDNKGVKIVDKYGDVTDDEIIDAIRYARRRRGCRIAMLDHLDFMVRHRRPGEDERSAKERVVRTLATVGVEDDIIIILICHPNNLSRVQQRRVEIGDLKGASAIRQDCHGAIVVEKLPPSNNRPFPAAMLYFDKIRSEFGQAGCKRLLAFDPLSCRSAARWEDTPAGQAGKRVVVP